MGLWMSAISVSRFSFFCFPLASDGCACYGEYFLAATARLLAEYALCGGLGLFAVWTVIGRF